MAAVVLSKPVVIAGITLEATELSYALQALAMTRAELEQVMAPSSAWPFPASLDGKGRRTSLAAADSSQFRSL